MEINNVTNNISPQPRKALNIKPAVEEKSNDSVKPENKTTSYSDVVDVREEVSYGAKTSQFKDVYAVSNKVFSLFQINGTQYTRERNLETGEIVYFP